MPVAVRVRMAPSPTGSPHIGNMRTAIFNFLFARHHGGTFILRIEDTDQLRVYEEAARAFEEALKWLGLSYDEGPGIGGPYGPYRQSERGALYAEHVERLLKEGHAYRCFCTREDLDRQRKQVQAEGRPPRYAGTCRALSEQEASVRAEHEPYVVRLKVDPHGETRVKDAIRGEVSFDHKSALDDFVIRKSDGFPTYNFACALDDHFMKVSHIIRAEEHLSNTPKQLLIYRAFGWDEPVFAHVSMILAPDRTKLSKRHGATSLAEFVEQGYLKEAIFNYLLLLGWSAGTDEEIFSVEEAIERFDLTGIQKSAAIYDVKKLTWLNGQYLRSLDVDDLVARARPFMVEKGLISPEPGRVDEAYLRDVVVAVRERVSTLSEVADAAVYFYEEPADYDEKGVRKHFMAEGAPERLQLLERHLSEAPFDDKERLEELFGQIADEAGERRGPFIHLTRLAVSGRTMGPGLFDIIALLGRDRTLRRLKAASAWIKQKQQAAQ